MRADKYTESMPMNNLERILAISHYNYNYYIGIGCDLLFASSDDDNTTEWWLINGKNNPIFIGYSYTDKGDLLEKRDTQYT